MDVNAAPDAANPSDTTTTYGKDSMNFAEWPLALLTEPGKSRSREPVTFIDTVRHPKTGEMVERSLTINPSAKYGHPTGLDADVLIGFIQLTQQESNFENPVVTFTRYQLIKVLRWRDEGWSYARIDESINRWQSVQLKYKRAWWDAKKQDWLSRTFSPINEANFYDKPGNPITIEWNRHVFADLQNNIKPLNLDLYFSLKRTASKQIYTYLDKHFHRPGRRTYNLRDFATAHAGLSDKHNNSQLKRQLQTYVTELEDKRFLKRLPPNNRYEQVRRGVWKVHFDKAPKPKKTPQADPNLDPITSALIDRRITKSVALKLTNSHPADYITTKIEIYDWYNTKRAQHKQPGWLRKAIEEDYTPPQGFTTKAQREAQANERQAKHAAAAAAKQQQQERQHQEAIRSAALNKQWQSLTEPQRETIRQKVLTNNDVLRHCYRKDHTSSIVHEMFLSELDKQQPATAEL